MGLNKCRWKEAEKLREAAINIKHRGKRNMDNYDYETIGYVVKWRGTNGKNHRRGGFGTVEEAAEFAKGKLETEDEVSVTQKRGVIGWWK